MSEGTNLLQMLLGTQETASSIATAKTTRAVAWARVSTDMQEARGLSLPEQLREIREYATKHEMTLVAEFSEAASAFQKEERRIEFRRMLSHVKANKEISVILVHDFSRFSRDSLRAKSLIRELRENGVRVISLNDLEADPETVAGVYLEAITFAKNEAFSREIAMHTRKGCRANVQTRDPETGWCYKNGGQPLFGYKTVRFQRGEEKRGRPIVKSIWMLDDSLVNGKSIHELARECLLMAAQGESLGQLRDFCIRNGIPARRKRYWGISTWNALLEPHCLLQFCGYGVWNVHRKNGSIRPAAEWVVVENAHPAIITEAEAKAIALARQKQGRKRFDKGYGRSRTSPYLLSGGPFKCGRCGANMTGLTTSSGAYYVCGSLPYRRGQGCGPGVYVPRVQLESDVLEGARALLAVCSDPQAFTREVNQELQRIWEERSGVDLDAQRKVQAIDAKIQNIRRAIEEGLSDAAWANIRLRELTAERSELAERTTTAHQMPRIDAKTALAYRQELDRALAQGEPAELKRVVRACVEEIKLAPERLEVEITYRIPEPVMNSVVAGAGFEPATSGL